MTTRLVPGDPGYPQALVFLVAKAAAQGFRLATPEERQHGDPRDLYSFSDRMGRMVGPVFVRVLPGQKETP